jgi:endonuclease I
VLPLLRPVIATATILVSLFAWNDVVYAFFVIGGGSTSTLLRSTPYRLGRYQGSRQMTEMFGACATTRWAVPARQVGYRTDGVPIMRWWWSLEVVVVDGVGMGTFGTVRPGIAAPRRRWYDGLAAGVVMAAVVALGPAVAAAAADLTVDQALGTQDGRSAAVSGFVVGQPVASDSVLRSGFTGDTALALSDSADETDAEQMIYVQVTSGYRGVFGLRTNPGLMGRRITVAGTLSAYFTHGGLKSPTSMREADPQPPPVEPGDPDDSYYAAALGKSGAQLRVALHGIIRTQTVLSYDQVWAALKDTDEDPANPANVILVYSGRSQSKSSNGGGANEWNREHVWAKSHGDFGTAAGPGTDVHHLRPEDVSVNANRGNKDFDTGGSPAAECPGCFTDTDSWEPRDAVKGDVARMVMYMAIRYEGDDGRADLELNDSVSNGGAPRIGRLSVLMQWHLADPPDAFEKRRNDVIFTRWQHNRNPFVDHPEWAAAIWG